MWHIANDALPQVRAMRFVDYISDKDSGSAAKAYIRKDNPLLTDHGLPAHAGIEYLAQALAGRKNLKSSSDVKNGVIVNIKEVSIKHPYFDMDKEIYISLKNELKEGSFEVWSGIVSQDQEIISAVIAVKVLVDVT